MPKDDEKSLTVERLVDLLSQDRHWLLIASRHPHAIEREWRIFRVWALTRALRSQPDIAGPQREEAIDTLMRELRPDDIDRATYRQLVAQREQEYTAAASTGSEPKALGRAVAARVLAPSPDDAVIEGFTDKVTQEVDDAQRFVQAVIGQLGPLTASEKDRESQASIDFFFAPPRTTPHKDHGADGVFSVLYLLRRELLETMGYHPDHDEEAQAVEGGPRNRLFASLVLMFTGFDLLAKFARGDDRKAEGIGERFRQFLRSSLVGLDPTAADLLWAVRNSLVHAFGVPDQTERDRLGMKGVALAQRLVTQTPIGPGSSIVTIDGAGTAIVFMDGVYRCLIDSIEAYRESLGDPDARARFVERFEKYGTIRIG